MFGNTFGEAVSDEYIKEVIPTSKLTLLISKFFLQMKYISKIITNNISYMLHVAATKDISEFLNMISY